MCIEIKILTLCIWKYLYGQLHSNIVFLTTVDGQVTVCVNSTHIKVCAHTIKFGIKEGSLGDAAIQRSTLRADTWLVTKRAPCIHPNRPQTANINNYKSNNLHLHPWQPCDLKTTMVTT